MKSVQSGEQPQRSEQCQECEGMGRIEELAPSTGGERIVKCPKCNGSGKQPPATDDKPQSVRKLHANVVKYLKHEADIAAPRGEQDEWTYRKYTDRISIYEGASQSRPQGSKIIAEFGPLDEKMVICIVNAHNAALKVELEKREHLEGLRTMTLDLYLTNEQKRIHQQLLSAQAKLSDVTLMRDAWEKASHRALKEIEQLVAERKPLVDALEWIVENGEDGTSITTKAKDALEKIKDL